MPAEEPDWRESLLMRLRERNRKESSCFREIVQQNNRLLDTVAHMKADNLKLSVENEQLRHGVSTGVGGAGGKDGSAAQLAIATLEKKLLAQQEELTDLHKRKGENSQLIVDLNIKVEKQLKIISEKEQCLAEQKTANGALRAEVQMLKNSLEELKKLNSILLDEHTALQLAFGALEEKLRGVQDENRCLVERLMRYKTKDADKLNEENESFLRKRSDKIRRDLEDAVREPNSQNTATTHRNSISPSQFGDDFDEDDLISNEGGGGASGDRLSQCGGGGPGGGSGDEMYAPVLKSTAKCRFMEATTVPKNIVMRFEAHESHAVRWAPVEKLVATGGADRKIKLWDVGRGLTEPRAVLGGSNGGINSVDFDSTGSYVLGTSNDCGARVWTVSDSRFRHALTGHSNKVMAAKYLQEPVKVVTGSHDRTLKIWDLRNAACIETKFVGSSCNDLVTTDSLGSTIISGHFDKRIRFWDIRTEKQADDVLMPAKITSLDISRDCYYLICSVRDDTIRLLDLRKNQMICTLSNENFKLSCDWARASFNMQGSKVACGSADGLIYVWNIDGILEATLKGHTSGSSGLFHSASVNAVSWSPTMNALASVGKGKRCVIYGES